MDDQCKFDVWETGHPKSVLWDNPEGLRWGGGGGGIQDGGHMYTMVDLC